MAECINSRQLINLWTLAIMTPETYHKYLAPTHPSTANVRQALEVMEKFESSTFMDRIQGRLQYAWYQVLRKIYGYCYVHFGLTFITVFIQKRLDRCRNNLTPMAYTYIENNRFGKK